MYGFQDVWLIQGATIIDLFINEFKERMEARFIKMAAYYDESPKCVLHRFVYDPYGPQKDNIQKNKIK